MNYIGNCYDKKVKLSYLHEHSVIKPIYLGFHVNFSFTSVTVINLWVP